MTENYQTLHYQVEDGISRITLDRPPLNLIDDLLTREYHSALKAADTDENVKVIVLAGAGKGLSGGLDIKFVEGFGSAEMRDFLRLFYLETINICRSLTKPMITMVHGFAREGACTLAFAGDMIIAADNADFGYPAVPNLAGPPGMHTWILQKLLGRMKAAELIFTGEPIGAIEAARLGLITRAVPAAELERQTMNLAAKIATMSPLALARTRKFMVRVAELSFDEVPELALDALASAFDSEDSTEARKAFKEKRKPIWTGK